MKDRKRADYLLPEAGSQRPELIYRKILEKQANRQTNKQTKPYKNQ